MDKSIFAWHGQAWSGLHRLRDRLPHAILFHGLQSTGKTRFAEHFAQSLLCEMPGADGHACGQCLSCGWFAQYGHPDYRRIRPEIFENDGAAGEEEAEPGADKKAVRQARAPSKEIKIDQIRALAGFLNVSTHRRGRRVVLLYPAEALNTAAANSLLKVLEEPPADTIFLLVSDGIDRLLPTILSRCRKFPLPIPAREQALQWLQAQGVVDARALLDEQGGAPLAAYAMAQGDARENTDALLGMLAKPAAETALKTAEKLQKSPPAELVASMQRWLHDLFSVKLSGRIRYYPQYGKELEALAQRAPTDGLLRLLKAANERRAVAEHPLAARLFIEDMLLDYSSIFS